MNAKKAFYVFLMLLLLLFSIGCDGGGSSKYEPKPYKGSTKSLEGTYHVRMSGEEKGLLVPFAGQNEKNTYDNGKIHVTKKDEKTLEMDYTPDLLWDRDPNSSRSRKPFKLDYDPKTGKATGRDDQGYDWEIDFYVRPETGKDGKDEIIMKRVSRTWENWLGASDKSYGSSDEGVDYQTPKRDNNQDNKKDNKQNTQQNKKDNKQNKKDNKQNNQQNSKQQKDNKQNKK